MSFYICDDEFAVNCFDYALGNETNPLAYEFIVHELNTLLLIAHKMQDGNKLNPTDCDRLDSCIFRLQGGLEVIMKRYPQA